MEETFPTLEEGDVYAASVREHSRGITQIRFELLNPDGSTDMTLGTWNKGSEKWYYLAHNQLS